MELSWPYTPTTYTHCEHALGSDVEMDTTWDDSDAEDDHVLLDSDGRAELHSCSWVFRQGFTSTITLPVIAVTVNVKFIFWSTTRE